jgi:hypothetical protein
MSPSFGVFVLVVDHIRRIDYLQRVVSPLLSILIALALIPVE